MSDKEKTEKLPRPIDKFIWLIASLAAAAVGYCLKTFLNIPSWLGAVYSLALMVLIIIAAQKVSTERAALAGNEEKKFAYALKTMLYYVYIVIAVILVFFSLWLTGIVSI